MFFFRGLAAPKACFAPVHASSSEKLFKSGENIELTCDPSSCQDIEFVHWYYASNSNSKQEWLGSTHLKLGTTYKSRKFNDQIDITSNDNEVHLKMKTSEEVSNIEYTCEIATTRTQRFCKSNQKFTVSTKGTKLFYKHNERGTLFFLQITQL